MGSPTGNGVIELLSMWHTGITGSHFAKYAMALDLLMNPDSQYRCVFMFCFKFICDTETERYKEFSSVGSFLKCLQELGPNLGTRNPT